jgi:hypothetical protein
MVTQVRGEAMKQLIRHLPVLVACTVLALPCLAPAQMASAIPPAITTPDRIQTQVGTLEFKDGAPSAATVEKVYDNLDFTQALNV